MNKILGINKAILTYFSLLPFFIFFFHDLSRWLSSSQVLALWQSQRCGSLLWAMVHWAQLGGQTCCSPTWFIEWGPIAVVQNLLISFSFPVLDENNIENLFIFFSLSITTLCGLGSRHCLVIGFSKAQKMDIGMYVVITCCTQIHNNSQILLTNRLITNILT